jgi:hypothetical protein
MKVIPAAALLLLVLVATASLQALAVAAGEHSTPPACSVCSVRSPFCKAWTERN